MAILATNIEIFGYNMRADMPIDPEFLTFICSKGASICTLNINGENLLYLTGQFTITKLMIDTFIKEHPKSSKESDDYDSEDFPYAFPAMAFGEGIEKELQNPSLAYRIIRNGDKAFAYMPPIIQEPILRTTSYIDLNSFIMKSTSKILFSSPMNINLSSQAIFQLEFNGSLTPGILSEICSHNTITLNSDQRVCINNCIISSCCNIQIIVNEEYGVINLNVDEDIDWLNNPMRDTFASNSKLKSTAVITDMAISIQQHIPTPISTVNAEILENSSEDLVEEEDEADTLETKVKLSLRI